jgi:hypothetical protein
MGTNYDTNAQLGIGYIGISQEPCHPTNILWTDEPWKGRVLYTGTVIIKIYLLFLKLGGHRLDLDIY